MPIYDVIVMTESMRLEGVEAENEEEAWKKAARDPGVAEFLDVFDGECSVRIEEAEVNFIVCDFCKKELRDPEALRYAEMRMPGVVQRGYACPGCLSDPDIDIYEMPRQKSAVFGGEGVVIS